MEDQNVAKLHPPDEDSFPLPTGKADRDFAKRQLTTESANWRQTIAQPKR